MIDQKTQELIAIGAAVSANCIPCVKYHTAKAKKLGLDLVSISEAIAVGQRVRKGAACEMDECLKELE